MIKTNQGPFPYGRLPGNSLVGFPATDKQIPSPKEQPEISIPALTFFGIPVFLQNYNAGKQVRVSLEPSTVFIAANVEPDWNPYQVSNHVARMPELVFQSPLAYIGLPG